MVNEGITKNGPPMCKARLVATGHTQKDGIDFIEIFSPIVKFKIIRTMLSFDACHDLELEQLDITTAFLHGDLDEVIYMR